jgi:predicted RNA-binding protein YlxR (DUF448 family)
MTRTERERAAPRAGRTRTCVGCGQRVDLEAGGSDLVRLVLGSDGEVAVDAGGGGFGRGAHVHARRTCLEKASAKGLAKAAKGRVVAVVGEEGSEPLGADALGRAIRAALDRRIRGLLVAATRSRAIAVGADAVTSACQRGEAHAVVVACDAAAEADLDEVRRAVPDGRAVAWGTKGALAALCPGGTEVSTGGLAVIAILSASIAAAVCDAARAADACGVVSLNVVERGA